MLDLGKQCWKHEGYLAFFCLRSVSLCSSMVIEHVIVSLTSARSFLFFRVLSMHSISSL